MNKPENLTSPEALGFSADRLRRLDRFLQEQYVDSGKIPCAQTLIYRGGRLAHQSVIGFADVERNRLLQEDAIFRIYSMTKPITSVAFMMLVEEGKVALSDPVHRFIPEFKDLGVFTSGTAGAFLTKRPERAMQMIDLLRHTSGLTYGFQNRTNVDAVYRATKLENWHETSIDEMIAHLAKIPLEFSPGDAWNYSVSTDVLGYLVAKISGIPFDQFLQQRIFDPLGMSDTGFHVPAEKAHRLPSCYARLPNGKVVLQEDCEGSPYLRAPKMCSGGGGLTGTGADYAKFCQMLLNGGEYNGHRLISPKTIELMTLNHLPENRELTDMSVSLFSEAVFNGLGFGLGFAVTIDLARTMNLGSEGEHFWGGMASTAFWIDPQEDLFVVFMTQLMPSSSYPIRRDLRTLIYSALTE